MTWSFNVSPLSQTTQEITQFLFFNLIYIFTKKKTEKEKKKGTKHKYNNHKLLIDLLTEGKSIRNQLIYDFPQ